MGYDKTKNDWLNWVLLNASSPVPSVASTATPSPSASPSVRPSVGGLFVPAKKEDVGAAISVVRELIRVAKSQNKDVQEAERLLNLAQQAFAAGDYAAASEFMRQSDAALKKAGVVTKGVSSAGFDWFTALLVLGVVALAGGAYWFYFHRKTSRFMKLGRQHRRAPSTPSDSTSSNRLLWAPTWRRENYCS